MIVDPNDGEIRPTGMAYKCHDIIDRLGGLQMP
jgi:hypothetical protein